MTPLPVGVLASTMPGPSAPLRPSTQTFYVLLTASFLVPNIILSMILGLDLHWATIIAATRCIIQLGVLGCVFTYLISHPQFWITAVWAFVVVCFAVLEAMNRSSMTYPYLWLHYFIALFVCCLPMAFAAGLVTQNNPEAPMVLLPFFGMLLSNTLTGMIMGTQHLLNAVIEKRGFLEIDFAMGATYWASMRPLVRAAAKTAMLPMVNNLSICGLVSIPGMMTGQLLAGADPNTAASYQAIIMLLIASSQALGISLLLAASVLSIEGPIGLVAWSRIKTHNGSVMSWEKLRSCCPKFPLIGRASPSVEADYVAL